MSLYTTLFLPYVGEEGVYTVTSQEMWHRQEWLTPFFYGSNYGRPPLYNWLIMSVTQMLGWSQVLVAARLVSATMTVATSLSLFFLIRFLTRGNALFAVLCTTAFLSGDVLFKRGWLAYADPTFGFFCFAACASVWVAVEKQQTRWFALAVWAVMAAYLSKALTVYILFWSTQAVLFWKHPGGHFLRRPRILCLQILSLLFPCVWNVWVTRGAHGPGMLQDIWNQWALLDGWTYVVNVLVFPLKLCLRRLPLSFVVLIAGWFYWQQRRIATRDVQSTWRLWFRFRQSLGSREKDVFLIAVVIFVINLLPYWLAPQSRVRYLLPLYPFLAIGFGYALWWSRARLLPVITGVWACSVILRFAMGFWGFPYYERHYRGDYQQVARDIVALANGKPIHTDYPSAIGISVVAYVNALRLPDRAPVSGISHSHESGFLISYHANHPGRKLIKTFVLGRTPIYLFELSPAFG